MSKNTKISWAHHTFNAWWGCVEVGPECDNCYARAFSHRLGLNLWGADAARRGQREGYWAQLRQWAWAAEKAGERHRVFIQSMSDILEDRRDLDMWRERLWRKIEELHQLDFLLLTKRPSKYATLTPSRWRRDGWPSNVWAGVTAGTQRTADVLVPQLLVAAGGARVRWVSCEPILESVSFERWLDRLNWIVVGEESGHKARHAQTDWFRTIRDQCLSAGAAFHLKQFTDDRGRAIHTPELDGRRWVEYPRVLFDLARQ